MVAARSLRVLDARLRVREPGGFAKGAVVRVLLTGAFGNLGRPTVQALVQRGHRVRCFDVRSRPAERLARSLGSQVEVSWGDLRDEHALRAAVAGQDAIIHNAAVLPPFTERSPEAAQAINVGGTRALIAAAEASPMQPALIFTSSVSVFGPVQHLPPPRRVTDPVQATDNYTRHKLECETMLRESSLRWLILRIGVSIEPGSRTGDPDAMRMLFDAAAETRMEYVHPADVACAQARALECAEVWGRMLLIGGGPSCRIRQIDLFDSLFGSLGLGEVPRRAFGSGGYYTDWMDTEESQRLLQYQQHSFDDFRRDSYRRLRHVRRALWPLRPLVRRYLLGYSRAWSGTGADSPAAG